MSKKSTLATAQKCRQLPDPNATVSVTSLGGPATSTPPRGQSQPYSEDRIRERAYLKWQAAGCPDGDGVAFWLEAEREVSTENQELDSDQVKDQ